MLGRFSEKTSLETKEKLSNIKREMHLCVSKMRNPEDINEAYDFLQKKIKKMP
jgi:hypothetical protein